jgi:hypothetical protein
MKAFVVIVGLVSLPSLARAQAVTLAELEGAVITFSAVHQERFIRNGQEMSNRMTTAGRVTVDGGKISGQMQNSATNQTTGRSRRGPTNAIGATLDQPTHGAQGNDVVWTFINGSLVRLRVFSSGAGGQKMTISFQRKGNDLTCSFAMPMAREVGVGEIRKTSAIDNVPIQVLQFTQISSSCQVSKG